MDLPSPLRHKFYEMLASVLTTSLVALIMGLCTPIHGLRELVVGLVSFAASMLVIFGRKAMPLQFAALFTMMLAGSPETSAGHPLLTAVLFFAGGMAYLLYAMVISWFLQERFKQQVLAEALYELARYMAVKADFYDMHKDLRAQFQRLVRQQIVLAEKQQASRDLILRGRHPEKNAHLVHVHYAMLDLYERLLAMHTDYTLLRQHFADGGLLPTLRVLALKVARDIEFAAYGMARNHPSVANTDYRKELAAIERALAHVGTDNPGSAEALAVLRATYGKIREVVQSVAWLHQAMHLNTGPLPMAPDANLTPFLTRQRYELRIIASELRLTSPTFRYAIRVAVAITLGLSIGHFLPYLSHGYWIALTIAVILKPNFSTTKRRLADRVIGTLIGCTLTALLLKFVHAPAALLGFLFLATAAAPTFLHIKYRYTAVAASMQALLLIGLTSPVAAQAVGERLLDTVVGAGIAVFFSYVLPYWEYQTLPRLIRQVLEANRSYIDAFRKLVKGETPDDFAYRISRKRFMDSIATLSGAILRMQDEPISKRCAPEDVNRFAVQNYLVVAHCAAMRLLLQRYRDTLPRAVANPAIDRLCDGVTGALMQAQAAFDASAAIDTPPVQPMAHEQASMADDAGDWPGWKPLQRRAALLEADANGIALLARAIALELGRVK
jgi:uncharacterized membrane protein YccC